MYGVWYRREVYPGCTREARRPLCAEISSLNTREAWRPLCAEVSSYTQGGLEASMRRGLILTSREARRPLCARSPF